MVEVPAPIIRISVAGRQMQSIHNLSQGETIVRDGAMAGLCRRRAKRAERL